MKSLMSDYNINEYKKHITIFEELLELLSYETYFGKVNVNFTYEEKYLIIDFENKYLKSKHFSNSYLFDKAVDTYLNNEHPLYLEFKKIVNVSDLQEFMLKQLSPFEYSF